MLVKGCSYSSDRKLRRCEMMYHYRYEEKIKPKQKKPGLFKGDWGHQLLEAKYRTGDWKPKFEELKSEKWDNIFEDEQEMYGLDFPDRVYELLEHYDEHWRAEEEGWKILSVEQEFELMTKFGFPIRWKADLIVREKNGSKSLVETKFKKAIPDSSERLLNVQVHSYAWLLRKVGIKIDDIIWNYIRTEPIPRPKVLKSGDLSERKINTDRRSYLLSLAEAGIHPSDSEEWLAITQKLDSLPETLSLERVRNTVNLKIGEKFVREWVERAKRAKEITHPLLNYVRECDWDCDYLNLCQADMRGDVDRKLIIIRDFVSADREELK